MAKIRLNEWAKANHFKSVDVMKKLLAHGYKVNRMSEKIEESVLDDIMIKGLDFRIPKKKNEKIKKAQISKEKKKKNNYRTNLYNARLERGFFTLDDLFEELDIEYSLSEDLKMAVGVNVKRKFKYKKGYNGTYLINLYEVEQKEEISTFVQSLV